MFCGEYSHNLDTKNRIMLPAKLRDDLGSKVVLAKSVDRCISLFTEERWTEFTEKLEKLPDIETRKVKRFLFSTAFETEIDSQGRILVPPGLCAYAGLQKSVVVIGVGDHIELWDSESWSSESSGEDAAEVAAILARLGF